MIQLNLQTREDLEKRIAYREGEIKLGQRIQIVSSLDNLQEANGKYVIFGICEDIGVQANYGRPGTSKAWKAFLNAFVNVQEHTLLEDRDTLKSDIIVLGFISVTPDEKITPDTAKDILGTIVERIDKKVADLVQRIVEANKIPLIIGGGHNNAFGNIKGSAQAKQTAINALNIDAHTDLRKTDYRHSGNGFSYALEHPDGSLLDRYVVFGLHQNYTPQYIFDFLERQKDRISFYLLKDMLLPGQQLEKFKEALLEVDKQPFGIELDCDSIAHFPSSAQSPSGFSLESVRAFMQISGASEKCIYLHICEARPEKKMASQVGKALTYLLTDFIRSHRDYNSL